MYTANTMASAIEVMGMSLPGSSAQNATSDTKLKDCRQAGEAVLRLLKHNIRPSDIMTRAAPGIPGGGNRRPGGRPLSEQKIIDLCLKAQKAIPISFSEQGGSLD